MKIIHISDLHIKEFSDVELIRYQTILDLIIKNRYPTGTVIVMTGDLVNRGYILRSGEWTNPAFDGIKKLEANGYNGRVLAIPGNHDYGVGIGITDFEHTHLQKMVEYFKETYYHNTATQYPIVTPIDDFVFIGLDSTAAALEQMEIKKLLTSEGKIGDKQIAELKKAILDAKGSGRKVVVYLHHHPYHKKKDGLKLIDAAEFLNTIDGQTTLLLFGHVHIEKDYGDDGYLDDRIDRIYNAGSSTNTDNYRKWESFYRIIDLDIEPKTDTIVPIPIYKLELHNFDELDLIVHWKLKYTVNGEARLREYSTYKGWVDVGTEIPFIAEDIQCDLAFDSSSVVSRKWPTVNGWKGNRKYLELNTNSMGEVVLRER